VQSSPSGNLVVQKALLIALSLVFFSGSAIPLFTPNDAAAQDQRPNCSNFIDRDDSQVVVKADPSDPFGLDESGQGDSTTCQQPASDFGTELPLVDCNDLRDFPDIATTLYDHSLSKYDSDRYNLASCTGDGMVGDVAVEQLAVPGEPVEPTGAPVASQPSSVHPYVTYVLAGGVPIGVNAFGIVVQRQTATDGNDQSVAAQAADGQDRRQDHHKKNHKNGKAKGQRPNEQAETLRSRRGEAAVGQFLQSVHERN
jgi:hypothetical protein